MLSACSSGVGGSGVVVMLVPLSYPASGCPVTGSLVFRESIGPALILRLPSPGIVCAVGAVALFVAVCVGLAEFDL